MTDPEIKRFVLPDGWKTQAGEPYPPGTYLAYKTFGDPSNQAVIYPTWYSGMIADNEWLVSDKHEGLNPSKYYVVIPAMFGNGQSSSPSNHPGQEPCPFPQTTFYDNVEAQHALVQHLGIKGKLFVTGWSMGAGQTFQWAVSYPDLVEKIVPFCGAARTAEHNQTFLYSLVKTLQLDPNFEGGAYAEGEKHEGGKKAFAAIYSAWGFSQAFYRQKLYQKLGFATLDKFLSEFWEPIFFEKDARNLIFLLRTWISGDITTTPGRPWSHDPKLGRSSDESYQQALGSIKARALVMPGKTDLYFPPEDSEIEVAGIGSHAQLDVIDSVWGHFAGGPGTNPEDVAYIDKAIAKFFAEK